MLTVTAGVLAVLMMRNFNECFVIFHEIFFDNDLWMFHPETDYRFECCRKVCLRILPQESDSLQDGFFYIFDYCNHSVSDGKEKAGRSRTILHKLILSIT